MTEVLDPQMAAMMEAARPRKQHEWLKQFVGAWEYESACVGPDGSTETSQGTQTYRMLGDLWLVGDGEGDMPGGGRAVTQLTLGYDAQKGRFVGTWLGSMMAYLWVYDGDLDEAERVLTVESDGPSFTKPGEVGKYRDVITVVNEDYHTLTGRFLDDNGQWQDMTTSHYRRTK